MHAIIVHARITAWCQKPIRIFGMALSHVCNPECSLCSPLLSSSSVRPLPFVFVKYIKTDLNLYMQNVNKLKEELLKAQATQTAQAAQAERIRGTRLNKAEGDGDGITWLG